MTCKRTTWAIIGESVNSGRDIGTLLTTNIAEAEISGIELEFDWAAWEGGRIFGWVSYLNAEITNLPGADDGWFCFERAYLGLTPCPAEDPTQVRGDNSFRRPTSFTGNKLPWSPRVVHNDHGRAQLVRWQVSDQPIRLGPLAGRDVLQ